MNFISIIDKFFPSKKVKWVCLVLALGSLMNLAFSSYQLSKVQKLRRPLSVKKMEEIPQNLNPLNALEFKNSLCDFSYQTIIDDIQVKGIHKDKKAYIYLIRAQIDLEIIDKEPLSIYYDDLGGMRLSKEKIGSPLEIIPSIQKNEVIFQIKDQFTRKGKTQATSVKQFKIPLMKENEKTLRLKKNLEKLKITAIDLFTSLYSEEKNKITIQLDHQIIECKENQTIWFDDQTIRLQKDPSFSTLVVNLTKDQKLIIDCVDASGYFSYQEIKDLKPKEKPFFPSIEEPKQIVIRGLDQIGGLFQGKRQLLKKGDFFTYIQGRWKKVDTIEALNQLMDKTTDYEIFVIEDIVIKKKKVDVSLRVFDRSRWNFNAIKWHFDLQKEKKSKEKQQIAIPAQKTKNPDEKINDKDESLF